MTAETLLETLATAIHQVAASFTLPPALAHAATAPKARGQVTFYDLASHVEVDPLGPRDMLATSIDETVRFLTRVAASKLEPGDTLIASVLPATPTEHPEPALLAPGLPIYVGVFEEAGQLVASIRIPFGVATA